MKIGYEQKATSDLANQVMDLNAADKLFKAADLEFKKQLSESVALLQRQRVMLPYVATGIAVIAIMLGVIAMAGSAQAVERLSNQIETQQQEIRHLSILAR